ncbi:uncharacterized protein LOC105842222 isoform X3 [Bombyx mori]|uniref:Synaptic plasticity regulator PANTS n=1 Tax=Bombyx mori TaxID=7091 RepID=A0A8R2DM59_BOMMO|nr:uncharacterized protein LOC105842222 isoform X3 [Bombyx mori]
MTDNNRRNEKNESEIHKESINTSNTTESQLEDKWMIRNCDIYEDEYDECTSFRARFHQYFIFGETLDCNQWKKDYDNCCKWESKKDVKAAEVDRGHGCLKDVAPGVLISLQTC